MRVSRGVQNKVLEAMAMARPVVAASACVAAIEARAGIEVVVADSADGYVQAVGALLDERERAHAIGLAGRRRVERDYRWPDQFGPLDRQLAALHLQGALS
jgi:glycosyltransferase involved in cell wall biosynthesis